MVETLLVNMTDGVSESCNEAVTTLWQYVHRGDASVLPPIGLRRRDARSTSNALSKDLQLANYNQIVRLTG